MPETKIKELHDRLGLAYPIVGKDLVSLITICEIHGELKLPRTLDEARQWREMARDMVHKYMATTRQILHGA